MVLTYQAVIRCVGWRCTQSNPGVPGPMHTSTLHHEYCIRELLEVAQDRQMQSVMHRLCIGVITDTLVITELRGVRVVQIP